MDYFQRNVNKKITDKNAVNRNFEIFETKTDTRFRRKIVPAKGKERRYAMSGRRLIKKRSARENRR